MNSAQTKSRPRLYLVEDSPIILDRLIEVFQTEATIIGHADNAATALSDIATLHPDVVTIDILLKRGSGFDVLEGIAISHDDHPPVRMMLTNNASDAYRQAAERLGAEYFFDKSRDVQKALNILESVEARPLAA